MWKRFKRMMGTRNAALITNSIFAVIWGVLAVTSEPLGLKVLLTANSLLMAFAAGMHLDRIVSDRIIDSKDRVIAIQERWIQEMVLEGIKRDHEKDREAS